MRRICTETADGRALVYFDETGDARRTLVDPRPLVPTRAAPTRRYDEVAEEWVTVAAHRQARTFLPSRDDCPLCPSGPGRQTEIPSADYDVVVLENRFPSFAPAATPTDWPATGRSSDATFVEEPAVGRCEVVCFTSDHDASFSALSPDRVRTVMDAWADRTADLTAVPGVRQVFCFENRGEEIGVTLRHPHGQIYAYPFVTPRTRRALEVARQHRARTGSDIFANRVASEVSSGRRLVSRTSLWTAFVPFAARWPLEVHIYPHRSVAGLPDLTGAERDDFAHVYLDVLRRMEAVHDDSLPYVAAWHQAPVGTPPDLAYLHLEVFSSRRAPGRLKYLAGSEAAMDAYINDVSPEDAARRLRDARP